MGEPEEGAGQEVVLVVRHLIKPPLVDQTFHRESKRRKFVLNLFNHRVFSLPLRYLKRQQVRVRPGRK